MKNTLKMYLYFVLVSLVQFGIEFAYNVPISTLFFISDLSPIQFNQNAHTSIKMTVGPVIGLFVQIIIGALSDHATFNMGRRRPFMLIGLGVWLLGAIIIVCSSIYPILFISCIDSSSENILTNGYITSDIFYVIGFVIWTIGINMIQLSYRSFILDEFDSKNQNQVNLMSSLMTGLAQILFYGISSIICISFNDFNERNNDSLNHHIKYMNIRLITVFSLYVLSIIILPICVWVFCHFAKETTFMSGGESPLYHIKNIWKSFISMNKNMYLILIVVFFGWISWTPMKENTQLLYNTYLFYHINDSFVFYNFNKLLFAITLSITSLVLFFINRIPEITLFIFNLIAFCTSILYYIPIHSNEHIDSFDPLAYCVSLIPLLSAALVYCQLNATPYALTRSVVEPDKFGFFLGIVNGSLTVSQFISNSLFLLVHGLFYNPEKQNDGKIVHYFMFAVCPSFVISAIITLLLLLVKKAPKINERATYAPLEEGV
ncbi:hypothetical protein EDI_107340 [Entamoeba dispar SAW760]|uniref:Sucrose transporter n=1 Tax=Entamoeba dispar (strain ATCC PRA-260 / SAW760) TaxID=370354 RepID=B0EEA5_ENTDS|nr:uncharacterized protein EDI_107340 [Entamoeba dispar SAW760]EDR27152.1 hypothetical protein EDI_107340 [Entamoeba dispar SAW760]|eukprot:EDR27152.1 hypothetical protein EDI_107340 [Entamoeba dispar SAW760]